MDPVNATSLPETILNATKIEIPTSCEQTITLTKMEIVDTQPEVDLENSNSQHLVETQYINLHRVSDLKNLTGDTIPPELLSHQVVDLGSNPEFSQHIVTNAQFYDNADFLSQSFSDEDRRLALVAVQLIQNRTGSPSADNLGADLLHGKTTLPSVSSISGDKTVMSTIVSNYVQAVDPATSRHQDLGMHIVNHSQVTEQHIVKSSGQQNDQIIKLYQPLLQQDKVEALTPLKKINQLPSRNAKYIADENNSKPVMVNSDFNSVQKASLQIPESLNQEIKTECNVTGELNTCDANEHISVEGYRVEVDQETPSSQKSLPHKKRIPSKLKKALTATPTRNIHAKCYKCTKCGEQFPTQSTFNSHKLQHSSKKAAYACELCSKICQNQLKFFEHLKSHYEPGLNPETVRNDATQPVGQAQQQFEDDEKPQIREQCETDQQLNESQETLYSTEQVPHLTCGKCNRVFRRQKAFDCHMSISHPKQEEIEEFSEPEDMMEGIRHVVNMVPTGDEEDKNFEPWGTPKSIENVVMTQQVVQNDSSANTVSAKATGSLKISQIKKEEPDLIDEDQANMKPRKEMQCPHCERTFVHRNSLLYHIRSHTGHRPHQCELCGKSFFAAGALKIHHRLHSGDKPYKCEYCGRFFRQWGDLKYHITSLHSNTKMFQCEYCGKDFARKYSLVVHRRIHTGEKNYICEYCTKTFRAASYLQNHRRIHTGEKPHMCEVCGKPFRVRSDMKRHMKTHPDVTSENNLTEVRDMCLLNNQDMTVDKQDEVNNATLSDHETDQNMKPVISESGTPLNLNVRPQSAQEGLYNYPREDLVDRENTGTLYVWIQTNSDTILPDA